jgi:hypothetical protein
MGTIVGSHEEFDPTYDLPSACIESENFAITPAAVSQERKWRFPRADRDFEK